jgi:hypothetical protein
MNRFLGFALTIAGVLALVTWASTILFPGMGAEGLRAVVTSAGVAFSVQLLTFGLARFFMPTNFMAGVGIGMLIRFAVLVGHGFIGAPLMGLPQTPALASLAAFFFLTTLIEPLFLPRTMPTPPKGEQT